MRLTNKLLIMFIEKREDLRIQIKLTQRCNVLLNLLQLVYK